MKTKIWLIIVGVVVLGAFPVQATVWTEGHYEIVDTNVYGEIYIYNDVTVDMFGGEVYKLETFDLTLTDWYAGVMTELVTHDDSLVNIYGGQLNRLESATNSWVSIYAYDVMYDPTGGHYGRGWLEGKYLSDNSQFGYSLITTDTYSHISIVPEPATFFLFGLGVLFLRKRR